MDYLQQILTIQDQNQLNQILTMLSENRNFEFFETAVQYALDSTHPLEQRVEVTLIAKNYLRQRSIDTKLSNYKQFNKKPKEQRQRIFEQIFAEIDEIPTAPELLAVLLEADSLNKGGLALHAETVSSLLDRCTENSYKTLQILFEDSSFSSVEILVEKQRNILEKLFGALKAVPEERFVSICLRIVKRLIRNTPHFCEQILQILIQMLGSYCAAGELGGNVIGDILDVFVEINRTKQQLVGAYLNEVYDFLAQIYSAFVGGAPLEQEILKIVYFFMQMDKCNYCINEGLAEKVLIPILLQNEDQQLSELCFECLEQFTQHTYIEATEVDASLVPFQQQLYYIQENINQLSDNLVTLASACTPLFYHRENRQLIQQISSAIFAALQREITAQNVHLLAGSGVIFVSNYINYAPCAEFLELEPQIQSVIDFLINNIQYVPHSLELFQAVSNYLEKLYVTGAADFASVFGVVLQQILVNLSELIISEAPNIVPVIQQFMQVDFCNYLFRNEVKYVLSENAEAITLEATKFMPEEIIIKKQLIERLNAELVVNIDATTAVTVSLQAMSNFTVNFFNLITSLKQAQKSYIFLLFLESCLSNLCQIIETLTQGIFRRNFFDEQCQFSLEQILNLYNENFKNLLTLFQTDVTSYHDCFCRVYDCYVRLAQVILIAGRTDYYEANLSFLLPLLSQSSQNPQNIIHVNSCELLANLVPLMGDEAAAEVYEFAVNQLQEDLMPMSRAMLSVICQSYIERATQLIPVDELYEQILAILIKNADYLNSAGADSKTTELCISTMQLAGVFFSRTFTVQRRVKSSDVSLILKSIYSYLENIDLNFELKEIGLSVQLHMVYGAINCSDNSRNVLVQPDVHRIIKETISIVSSSEEELVQNVLHVFMQDYNLVMEGKK